MGGVFDMKARLIYKNNQSRRTLQVVLAVQVKELAVLHGLAEMTGTSPEFMIGRPVKDFMRKGCVEHCPDQHIHAVPRYPLGTLPPTGRWTITGAALVVVLENLKPYLMVDREYDLAIEHVVRDLALTGQGSGAVLKALARLKGLGWKLPDFEALLAEVEERNRPATRDELASILAGVD